MLKKVLAFLVCVTLMTAIVSWAATTWQLQTKLSNAGGTLRVRNNAPQTVAGSVVYTNFTTSANVPVTVAANTGYNISSIYKTGVAVSLGNYTTHYADNYNKSAGTTQSLVASFVAKSMPITTAVTGPGSITPATTSVTYNSSINLIASPTYTNGIVTAITVNGIPYPGTYPSPTRITVALTNVTAPTTVAATFVNVTANAGADQLVVTNTPVTLNGSSSGGAVTAWSQVSGPATVDTSGWNTLTPSFTPSVTGSYVFTLTASVGGTVKASSSAKVTVTNSITDFMRSSCSGCHAPAGVDPSTAFALWSTSVHKTGNVNCITCHTDGAMPTPVNTATVDVATYVVKSTTAGTIGSNYCVTCHDASIATEFAAARHSSAITCSTCHFSPHKPTAPSSSTFKVYTTGGYLGRVICFDCHGGVNTTHYFSKPAIDNVCSGCHDSASHNPVATMATDVGNSHFNGYTSSANAGYRAAYVTGTTQCANCHLSSGGLPDPARDPALLAERSDWAASGHGDTKGAGWTGANFKALSGCVQCHTSVGFVAYSTAKVTGAWGAAADKSSAVLSCNSCHTDLATGSLRAAAPIRPYSNDSYVAPDVAGSNLCMKCHCGTQSGRSIKAQAAADANVINQAFTGSHSSAAAGILFKSAGYEFASKDYSNKWHFKHDRIGNNHFKAYGYDSGSAGPCIGCHMTSPNSHSFSPLARDANGVITAIRGTSCAGCHSGPAYLDAGRMSSREAKFAASLAALQKVLESKGIYYANVAPYFFRSAGNTDPGNAFTGWGTTDTLGAAFNFNLLQHEAGAYAHNMIYSKRLIYDSIDLLDNGVLDGSVVSTINGLSGLDPAQKAAAAGYLAPSGGRP